MFDARRAQFDIEMLHGDADPAFLVPGRNDD
jgi:hypothetical protein